MYRNEDNTAVIANPQVTVDNDSVPKVWPKIYGDTKHHKYFHFNLRWILEMMIISVILTYNLNYYLILMIVDIIY